MVVCKTFVTPYGKYVYDRNKNDLIRISETEFECIENNEFDSPILHTLKEKRYLEESMIEEIQHPQCRNVQHFLQNRLFHMILQVTQNCNLRCSYCAYSGSYEHRAHSNLRMDFETAKKAIDLLIENSVENNVIALGFYGGEPMLEMELIKKCVYYTKEKVKDKKIVFSMTTNGTLLTDSNIRFIKEYDFQILISLDGTKEDHDINRKFVNGKGSFDVIMKNVKHIKENYPEFMNNISFNAVLNPKSNYSCVRDYFFTNEVVLESSFMMNIIADEHRKKEDISFDAAFHLARAYDYFLLIMSMLKKCDEKLVPRAVLEQKRGIHSFYDQLKDIGCVGKKCHHGGPCIPGGKRVFVSTKGEMYPCEKVPEVNVMSIGNLEYGFNLDNIKKLMNIGKISDKQCKGCWAFIYCTQCVNQVVDKEQLSQSAKLKHCPEAKDIAQRGFEQILLLKELGYDFEEELL